jgi:hypothetical protein
VTTVQSLIEEIRNDHLLTGIAEQRNLLDLAVDTDDTTIRFTYPINGVTEGQRISIGLEDMYVWTTNASAKTAEVDRGEFGTTATTHDANVVIRVRPRWSDGQILRHINAEIASLTSAGLWAMRTVDLTSVAGQMGYDMDGVVQDDVLGIHSVRWDYGSIDMDYPTVHRSLWEYQRDLPTADFPAGHAIFIRDANVDPNATVRVAYRSPLDAGLDAYADDVETVSGLRSSAKDLLALGTAIRLIAGREVHRNFDETQGQTRRAEEVPPGANLGGLRGLMALREQRIKEERSLLARLYPQVV